MMVIMNRTRALKLKDKDNMMRKFLRTLKPPIRIGLAYNKFLKKHPIGYKTFQRLVEEYADRNFIDVHKSYGGEQGTTTIITKIRCK